MKKIKIIDLLNRIANGEDVPKRIKYNLNLPTYQILIYDEWEKEYRFKNSYDEFWEVPNHHLNDEVEIIEDKKEKLEVKTAEGDLIKFDDNGLYVKYNNGNSFTVTNKSIIQIPKLILDDEERLIGQQHTYKTRVLDRIMIKRINDLVSEVNRLRGENNHE